MQLYWKCVACDHSGDFDSDAPGDFYDFIAHIYHHAVKPPCNHRQLLVGTNPNLVNYGPTDREVILYTNVRAVDYDYITNKQSNYFAINDHFAIKATCTCPTGICPQEVCSLVAHTTDAGAVTHFTAIVPERSKPKTIFQAVAAGPIRAKEEGSFIWVDPDTMCQVTRTVMNNQFFSFQAGQVATIYQYKNGACFVGPLADKNKITIQ